MINYVVDASVAVQHLVADTYTINADALFNELGASVALYIPEFCLVECANVLWKRGQFHNLPQAQADKLLTDFIGLPFTIVPVSAFLVDGLLIGAAHRLAVYDSVYIALAKKFNYPLITTDVRQEQIARTVGITLKSITDFKP